MRRTLELTPGPCPWEPLARSTLALLALISLLLAPTFWAWKAAGLAALATTWLFSAPRRSASPAPALKLYPDGAASLVWNGREQPVALTGRVWISRVLCVIAVRRVSDGATEWLRVCAANQSASVYRRFLGLLRLRAYETTEGRND